MIGNDQAYKGVLRLFLKRGFTKMENIHESTVKKIFHDVTILHTQQTYKEQIFEEIINECIQRFYGEISPHHIGIIISQAKSIIQERLFQLQGEDGLIKKKELLLGKKREQQQQILKTQEEAQEIKIVSANISELQKQLALLRRDQRLFSEQLKILSTLHQPVHVQQKQKSQSDKRSESSVDLHEISECLPVAFYCACVCLLFQYLITQKRENFGCLLVSIHTIYFILFGYNSRKSGMYLVVELFVTIVLDVIFLILHWILNIQFPAIRFSGDETFTKVIGFLMLASIGLRIVILANVYGYKEIQTIKTHYRIFGKEFELNRKLFMEFERMEK